MMWWTLAVKCHADRRQVQLDEMLMLRERTSLVGAALAEVEILCS